MRVIRSLAAKPGTFLAAYLLAIVIYSLIYTFATPRGFYAPYARLEPSVARDRGAVVSALEASIRRNVEARPAGSPAWRITKEAVSVRLVGPSDRLLFNVYVARPDVGSSSLPARTQAVVPVEILGEPFDIDVSGDRWMFAVEVDGGRDQSPEVQELLELLFDRAGDLDRSRMLTLSMTEAATVGVFADGLRGRASSFAGFWPRMLYFSATTITTTGFGDIVPTTPATRALAGSEAVLGWILAGLFLNAVAGRASRPLGTGNG